MKYLETEHEKKSFAITTAIFVVLLLLCFFFGMTYMDPPPENGIAINFGTTEFGSGDIQPTEPVASAPQPSESAPDPTPVTEDVITQDETDAPVITKEKPKPEKPKEKQPEKPKKEPAPTPSKSTTDALNSLINGPKSDGKAQGGEGDDDKAGDKGSPDGDPYASAYYGGGGGNGSGKKYGLNGRSIVSTGKVQQDCNEEGTVVVKIEVDKTGRVVKTTPGVQGTTNNASCLLKAARETAFKYRWNLDEKAPNTQIGFIVVNFKLGD
jgi:hypothetical protein